MQGAGESGNTTVQQCVTSSGLDEKGCREVAREGREGGGEGRRRVRSREREGRKGDGRRRMEL